MTQTEAASPPLPFPGERRAKATGPPPPASHRAVARAGAKPLPARRHGAHDQVPTNRVSTVTGHCLNLVDEASARSAIAETNHDPQPTTP